MQSWPHPVTAPFLLFVSSCSVLCSLLFPASTQLKTSSKSTLHACSSAHLQLLHPGTTTSCSSSKLQPDNISPSSTSSAMEPQQLKLHLARSSRPSPAPRHPEDLAMPTAAPPCMELSTQALRHPRGSRPRQRSSSSSSMHPQPPAGLFNVVVTPQDPAAYTSSVSLGGKKFNSTITVA
ncbi:hypothetical protein KSP39_PZI009346 [Platanthera zijinensis]|uniref:Uncharacterized protein n=1 Tax=Platanthera zijinensis TaxID=2320716 RepID=A0AAP0BLF9_9ASPA